MNPETAFLTPQRELALEIAETNNLGQTSAIINGILFVMQIELTGLEYYTDKPNVITNRENTLKEALGELENKTLYTTILTIIRENIDSLRVQGSLSDIDMEKIDNVVESGHDIDIVFYTILRLALPENIVNIIEAGGGLDMREQRVVKLSNLTVDLILTLLETNPNVTRESLVNTSLQLHSAGNTNLDPIQIQKMVLLTQRAWSTMKAMNE